MNATLLKTEALCWLRYVRKMDLICTEGGPWNSDVIGTTDNFSIEVEVKTSRADLLAEFRNKTSKHAYYQTGQRFCPTYFYFLVPSEIEADALEIIPDRMPKAGIVVYHNPDARAGRRLNVVRMAKKLRTLKPTPAFKRQVMLRMGSELCGAHIALDGSRLIHEVQDIKDSLIKALISDHGPAEWEDVDETDTNQGTVRSD